MADPVSIAVNVALIAANMALTASQQFTGPRLDELKVTTADYGATLNYVYGIRRLEGLVCIWAEPLKEVESTQKTKGGKFNNFTYFGTWAIVVCDHPADAILRIWFDRNLVFDATGAGPVSPFEFSDGTGITDFMTFYLGADDQEPDPRMAATVDAEHGAGSTPAYRGVTYIVFKDLPLEKLGNRLPQVSVEVATLGAPTYPYTERNAAYRSDLRTWFSADGSRAYWTSADADDLSIAHLEIWDVRATALMSHVVLDNVAPQTRIGIDDAGRIFMTGPPLSKTLVVMDPDGQVERVIGPPDITWGPDYLLYPEIEGVTVIDGLAYCTGWSSNTYGWLYVYPSDKAILIKSERQLKCYFTDAYGGRWELGGGGDLAPDELYVNQFGVGEGAPSTVGTAHVTMPIVNGSAVTEVSGFHCKDGEDDYLIISWGAGAGCVVALAWADLSIANQIIGGSAKFDPWHAANVAPGSRYLWHNMEKWDYVNMAVVQTVVPADWNIAYGGASVAIYDRHSNALLLDIYPDILAWLYLDRASGDGVTLRSIVEDVAERSGLVVADDIDATALTQTVLGYSWTQGQGKAILDPLIEAYDSDVRPHDFKLEFRRRGDALAATIPVGDMGAGGAPRYEVATTLDSDIPVKANLTFADLDSDQQPNTAIAQRAGQATDSRRELSLDLTTLALHPDDARPIVDGYLRREWMKAQSISLSLTREWSKLEPGDVYTLQLDDVARGAKLVRLEFGANGVLTTQWERYAAAVHTGTALPGAPADGLTPAVLPTFGYAKGLFLDIPLVEDAHDGLIAYLAAAPYSDIPFPGASFERGDDGVTFDESAGTVGSAQVATMGSSLSALPDAMASVWDEASVVTVRMFRGTLTSATRAQVAGGANRAILGDEIIGFRNATLVAEATYQLSGLHRGRRGTEWATGTHAVGDRFALLSGLPRVVMGASDVGDSFFVRPRTNGGPAGFAQAVDPFTGASLKPYAPAHLKVADVAGDLVATWTRRTRIGGVWRDLQDVPLGEGSESYDVRVLDGAGLEVRNLGPVSTPTATYAAADIATDAGAGELIRVRQVSVTVGNGFAADIAI